MEFKTDWVKALSFDNLGISLEYLDISLEYHDISLEYLQFSWRIMKRDLESSFAHYSRSNKANDRNYC